MTSDVYAAGLHLCNVCGHEFKSSRPCSPSCKFRPSNSHIGMLVDNAGVLKAQICGLQSKFNAVREELLAMGKGEHDGDEFHALVSAPERSTLDIKAARAKLEELGVSHQWFAAHTTTKAIPTLTITAREAVAA
jgi:hypothetical protein